MLSFEERGQRSGTTLASGAVGRSSLRMTGGGVFLYE
jgi:hypothetical protein